MEQCQNCGFRGIGKELEMHHIIPRFLGGTDKDDRLLLCKRCHDNFRDFLREICKATKHLMNNYKSYVKEGDDNGC